MSLILPHQGLGWRATWTRRAPRAMVKVTTAWRSVKGHGVLCYRTDNIVSCVMCEDLCVQRAWATWQVESEKFFEKTTSIMPFRLLQLVGYLKVRGERGHFVLHFKVSLRVLLTVVKVFRVCAIVIVSSLWEVSRLDVVRMVIQILFSDG